MSVPASREEKLSWLERFSPEAMGAAKLICQDAGVERCDVAIVAGTGWKTAIDHLGTPIAEFRAVDYPGFFTPKAEGHEGLIRIFRIGQTFALVFLGRIHLYEFKHWEGMGAITHYVNVAFATGCQAYIHTSAVGLVRLDWPIGQAVIIGDCNRYVTGFPEHLIGSPFHDVTASYDPELRTLLGNIEPLPEANFAQIRGPSFQTKKETLYLRNNNIDVVGMSGLAEKEMAMRLGLPFCHLAIGTDYAGTPATHEGIQAVVFQQAEKMGVILKKAIEWL